MRERDPTSKFLLAFLSSPSGDSPFTYLISHHIISVEHVVIMTDTSDEVFQSAATVMLRLARASVWVLDAWHSMRLLHTLPLMPMYMQL